MKRRNFLLLWPLAAAALGGPHLSAQEDESRPLTFEAAYAFDAFSNVMGGVARRAWARNENAVETAVLWNERSGGTGHITIPQPADGELVRKTAATAFPEDWSG